MSPQWDTGDSHHILSDSLQEETISKNRKNSRSQYEALGGSLVPQKPGQRTLKETLDSGLSFFHTRTSERQTDDLHQTMDQRKLLMPFWEKDDLVAYGQTEEYRGEEVRFATGLVSKKKAIVSELWRCIQQESDEIRVKAIDILGTLRHPLTLPILLRALDDPYWEVRAAAAQALGEFGKRVKARPLVRAFSHEADTTVRQALIYAMGQLREPQLLEIFTAVLVDQQEDCLTREAAAQALGLFEEKAPMQKLALALHSDPDALVRAAAAHALGMTKNVEAEPLLQKAKECDSELDVQEAASTALQQIEKMKRLRQFSDNQYFKA